VEHRLDPVVGFIFPHRTASLCIKLRPFCTRKSGRRRTIVTQHVFSTSACGFSTVRAFSAAPKRLKSHKKNVEEITLKLKNFI